MKIIKNLIKLLIVGAAICCMMVGFAACGDDEGDRVYLDGIQVHVDKTEVKQGDTVKLTIIKSPSDANWVNDGNGKNKYSDSYITYYVKNGNNGEKIGSGSEVSYEVKSAGGIQVYAVYCDHYRQQHDKDSKDFTSKNVTIEVEGEKISTAEELKAIANSDGAFELGNNIDLGGATWDPIMFSGALNGKGHSILNFRLDANTDNVGFFSVLQGTVANTSFEDVQVQIANSRTNIGIVAGTNKGTISDCTVSGEVDAVTSTNVGGIAGLNESGGSISNCTNNATVEGKHYIGGIVGRSNGTIKSSKNVKNVEGDGYVGGIAGYIYYRSGTIAIAGNNNSGEVKGGDYTGGIAGYIDVLSCNVEDCSNTAKITGENNVGGLFGYVDGSLFTVTSSSNEADVAGGNYVGGTFGYVIGSATVTGVTNSVNITGKVYVGGIIGSGENVKLTDCTNLGAITANSTVIEDNSPCTYVGGLAGYCSTITNSSNETEMVGSGNYVGGLAGKSGSIQGGINTAGVNGRGNYVGGLAGYAQGSINDSINEGNVKAEKNSCGGLAGYCAISSSAVSTSISGNSNLGIVKGSNNSGGIIGYLYINGISCNIETNTVTANVTGEDNTGGLVGYVSFVNSGARATITNCSIASEVMGSNYVGGVIGDSEGTTTVDRQTNNNAVTGKAYLGGIIGEGASTTLRNCENYGVITSKGFITESNKNCSYVGGLAGYCGEIEYGKNEVAISATGMYVGGLAGRSSAVRNSTNTGSVTGNDGYVGGIVGYIYYRSGTIAIAGNNNSGEVKGGDYTGGIAGYIDVLSCNVEDCSNTAKIAGENNVGGLFGYANVYGSSSTMNVVNCTNQGVIIGTSNYDDLIGKWSGKVIIQE